jgi:uncharacterized protein YndB with AHSA1/START domain
MNLKGKPVITVKAEINSPVETVWKFWTTPEDILKWNHASADWHTTMVENDLFVGGKFLSRMESKDGSFGFDFVGVYLKIKTNKLIEYIIVDGRKVKIDFTGKDGTTTLVESFETESSNSLELQQRGWQAILDNFKAYVEDYK